MLGSFTKLLLKGNPATRLVEMDIKHRVLLKIMNECFFQKGGGADQPNSDHKLVLYFLAGCQPINLPRYIMHHLCWAIKEAYKGKRRQVPCGRLLSEIFYQGGVLRTLETFNLVSDRVLGTTTGRMINGTSLFNMKAIKTILTDSKDLEESDAPFPFIKNFPSILRENNPEALSAYLAAFAKESGEAQRKSEVAVARKQKAANTQATTFGTVTAPKRKRGKADANMEERYQRAQEEKEAGFVEVVRPLKRLATGEIVMSMFEPTPEQQKSEFGQEAGRKCCEGSSAGSARNFKNL